MEIKNWLSKEKNILRFSIVKTLHNKRLVDAFFLFQLAAIKDDVFLLI